jgi:hypothetical protein
MITVRFGPFWLAGSVGIRALMKLFTTHDVLAR